MNYIKVTYPVGSSFIKSTFEDNSSYIKTSVNSTFIKVSYDGGSSGLDAERLRTKVYNVTGTTLTKGTIVYINGSHGNLPSVAKAIATSDATSAQTFGLVMEDITDNKSGYIILAGKIGDLDTQAIANGSQLYLSSTVAGTYTTTKQYAPAHLVYIGVVNRSHPTQGEIEVKIQNGYEADEIHDFAVRNPSNNDGIFFNSATSLWEKKSIGTVLGYTPANAATTLTINGVTYDLSQNRSWTIAAGISGSGTSGQVSYWTGTSAQSGSNNLFWNSANNRLGVGTNIPYLRIHSTSGVAASTTDFSNSTSTGSIIILRTNATTGNTNGILTVGNSGDTIVGDLAINPFGGNVMIGSQLSSGERLQVTGDVKIVGSGATSATRALTIQNSTLTNILSVRNDGVTISVGGIAVGGSGSVAGIFPSNSGNLATLIVNSSADLPTTNINDIILTNAQGNATITSGIRNLVQISRGFNPTSGTGVYNLLQITTTINQTGGANGITRGLYVAPILTAAADWRSIEWSNNSGWGLYGAGTANNYLGGSLGIGSTTLTGVNLRVTKNITGATTSLGLWVDGRIQNDVTANAILINASATSNVSGFNTANVYHFYADRANYSSTATNAFGFAVDITLNYATNNYGFYGNIAAGTGRWNLYMNGTAANYMNGELLLGSTTNSGERLQVTGTTRLNGSLVFTNGNGIISTTGSYKYFEFYDPGSATNSYLIAHATVGEHQFGFGTNSGSIAGSAFYNMVLSRTGLMLRDTLSTTSTSVASAVFDLRSTTRGFLPPRMTTTQKNAISSPAAGLVVYDTTDNKHYGYNGTTWNAFY